MARRLTMTMTVAVLVLVAAGCRSAAPSSQSPLPTASVFPQPTFTLSSPLPSPSVASPTPSPAPTSPPSTCTPTQAPSAYLGVVREGGALGEVWNLADVRYGLHADRLRVVWEMAEPRDHVPRFRVVEVDNAVSPFPTGHDPTWGVARIDVTVSDLYAYDCSAMQQLPLTPPDNPRVTRIGRYPTFDDALLGFSVGLKAVSAYEVYELTDPVRIVIDVLYGE